MRDVGPRVHGLIDYAAVGVFLAAPGLLDFTGMAATAAYTLAVAHLLLTMLTDFPLGVRRAVPFRLHRAVEFTVGLVLVVAPWVLAEALPLEGRLFYGVMGVGLLALVLTTKERRVKEAPGKPPEG